MRWWGWGDPGHPRELPKGAMRFLTAALGRLGRPSPPVALDAVRLPAGSLGAAALARRVRIVGDGGVRADDAERAAHARRRGYPGLLRLGGGDAEAAPDAVRLPD